MALNKLRKFDEKSAGVTLPKDDLRLEGLVGEDGTIEGEHQVHVKHEGDGEWKLQLVDDL